jgi:hypothetical protein
MITTRKNLSKMLIALTVAIAAAAVLTSSASAKFGDSRPQGYEGITQQNAGSGGVTPTDLARAVPRDSNAPAGVTPTDLARSVPSSDDTALQLQSAKSDPVWSSVDRDLAIGFGLGLALAIFASVALVMSRNRMRVAHS